MPNTIIRPTYLEVDLDRLRRNLLNIRAHVKPARVMAVVKANAYGHGMDGVAPYLEPDADYFGVATIEEGIHLRELGIRKPVLVMGGTLADQLPLLTGHDLTLAVSSVALLHAAEAEARASGRTIRVHLKVDTGMERLGVHDYEAETFIRDSLDCDHLEIEGIFSHFANAETPDLTSAREQLARFRAVLEIYDRLGVPRPPLQHTANSGAILQLPESHMGMVRAGVMLYGIYPDRHIRRIVDVQPALTWHSRVAHSKITQPGRPVSYGSTWRPEHPTRILTLPCGYADGYFRRMSNIAKVIVRGDLHQQVGRICMDHFMVDVGNLDVGIGEDAILLGRSPSGCSITAEDLADWAGTNEYEVMTSISARVPRMYKSPARRE